MDAESWYASLPTMYGSAAALITDTDGPSARVLLVKPNYRERWSLPGGILEEGEPPHVGCFREVEEELGLLLPAGPLLAVSWTAPEGDRPKPIISFIFDGGVLAAQAASGCRKKNSTTGGSPIRLNSASICHPFSSRGRKPHWPPASPASRRTSPSRSPSPERGRHRPSRRA